MGGSWPAFHNRTGNRHEQAEPMEKRWGEKKHDSFRDHEPICTIDIWVNPMLYWIYHHPHVFTLSSGKKWILGSCCTSGGDRAPVHGSSAPETCTPCFHTYICVVWDKAPQIRLDAPGSASWSVNFGNWAVRGLQNAMNLVPGGERERRERERERERARDNYIHIYMPVSHIQSHQITIFDHFGGIVGSWGILYFQSPRYASPSHRSSRSSEDCSAFWAAFCDLARRLGECQLGLKQGVPQQSSIYCNRVAILMGNRETHRKS